MRILFFFAFVAVLLTVPALKSRAQTAEIPSSVVPSSQAVQNEPHDPLVVFSQTDPRWAHASLGTKTISTSGCKLTSLAMAAVEQGMDTDPGRLALLLRRAGILKRNLVDSHQLSRALPLSFVERLFDIGPHPVARVANKLAQGFVVLLQLNHSARGSRGEHWVLVTSSSGDDLIVADPVHGQNSLRSLYGRLGIRSVLVLAPTRL